MASPSEFRDLFFDMKTDGPSPNDDSTKIVCAQFSNRLYVVGQGTIAVKSSATSSLQFFVTTDDENDPTLELCICPEEIFWKISGLSDPDFQWIKCPNAGFLCPDTDTTYWLSINGADGIIRYGKHLSNGAMTLTKPNLRATGDASSKDDTLGSSAHTPLPVLYDCFPWILSKDHVTLMEIDQGVYTSAACLPTECRTLYNNITATPILLNSKELPDFLGAVQRSCNTPDYWGCEKLREQAMENKTTLESSRLVFTLGYNPNGRHNIPYILEIWPAGHSSAILGYNDACGVIKILAGEARFPWHHKSKNVYYQLGPEAKFEPGDVTWFFAPVTMTLIIATGRHREPTMSAKSRIGLSRSCIIECLDRNVYEEGYSGGRWEDRTIESDMAFADFGRVLRGERDPYAATTKRRRYNI